MFEGVLVVLLSIVTLTAGWALMRISRIVSKHSYRPAPPNSNELPTVSVCIPARNEVHAMTECLERVLASDYPKLEIIVLDDSSVDDTSILIKSFAHAGVRFIEGRPLPEGWLGKNNALQGLLEAASGQYVLFLDVDTTLRPSSISQLVATATTHQYNLVSVLPQREDGLRASVFLGTLRYFWILFSQHMTRPAMSGACWLVSREKLAALGGFGDYKACTQPEDNIADVLKKSQLIISNKQLGISYEKKWTSQVETSTRLLRPLLGGTAKSVMVAGIIVTMVIVPLIGMVVGVQRAHPVILVLSGLSLLFLTCASLRYYKTVWRYGWWLGALHWPYVLLQEAALILISIYKYSRGAVTWKGRLINASGR